MGYKVAQPLNALSLVNLIMQMALEANTRQIATENGHGPYIAEEDVTQVLNMFAHRRGKVSGKSGQHWDYKQAMKDSVLKEPITELSEAAIEVVIATAEWEHLREESAFSEEADKALPEALQKVHDARAALNKEVQFFTRYLRDNPTDRETGEAINQKLAVYASAMHQVATAACAADVVINPDIEAMVRFDQAKQQRMV
jgi:hypothetical protein